MSRRELAPTSTTEPKWVGGYQPRAGGPTPPGGHLHGRADGRAIRLARAAADEPEARPVRVLTDLVAIDVDRVREPEVRRVERARADHEILIAEVVDVDERGALQRLLIECGPRGAIGRVLERAVVALAPQPRVRVVGVARALLGIVRRGEQHVLLAVEVEIGEERDVVAFGPRAADVLAMDAGDLVAGSHELPE